MKIPFTPRCRQPGLLSRLGFLFVVARTARAGRHFIRDIGIDLAVCRLGRAFLPDTSATVRDLASYVSSRCAAHDLVLGARSRRLFAQSQRSAQRGSYGAVRSPSPGRRIFRFVLDGARTPGGGRQRRSRRGARLSAPATARGPWTVRACEGKKSSAPRTRPFESVALFVYFRRHPSHGSCASFSRPPGTPCAKSPTIPKDSAPSPCCTHGTSSS